MKASPAIRHARTEGRDRLGHSEVGIGLVAARKYAIYHHDVLQRYIHGIIYRDTHVGVAAAAARCRAATITAHQYAPPNIVMRTVVDGDNAFACGPDPHVLDQIIVIAIVVVVSSYTEGSVERTVFEGNVTGVVKITAVFKCDALYFIKLSLRAERPMNRLPRIKTLPGFRAWM